MADVIAPTEAHYRISPQAVRWTREDCEKLEKAGVLTYRYELVEGAINKTGQNIGHGILVRMLLEWLFAAFGSRYVLSQISIDVRPEDNPTSKPEPDLIVLTRPAEEFLNNPTPGDIRLLIEAADTTLTYDLTVKAALYARAGIVDYWVMSLSERHLYIHRQPKNGVYQEITIHEENERISPLAANLGMNQGDTSGRTVLISSLLPAGT